MDMDLDQFFSDIFDSVLTRTRFKYPEKPSAYDHSLEPTILLNIREAAEMVIGEQMHRLSQLVRKNEKNLVKMVLSNMETGELARRLWTKQAEAESKEAVAPEGWEPTVKKMKKHPEIDNPWALSWYMKNKGDTPGGKSAAEDFEDALLAQRVAARHSSTVALALPDKVKAAFATRKVDKDDGISEAFKQAQRFEEES
jgi:hypothetical protein